MKKKIDIKYAGLPNICFSLTEKNDDREPEYSKQRIKRGFDDSETWCLRSTIVKFVLPRLKRFRKISPCYPSTMTKDEWNVILDKMILAFQIINDDEFADFCDEEWKQIDEGLDLFRQNFFALWW